MSFVRFIRMIVAFAASSGAALILSGNAWAASADLSTTTQDVSPLATAQPTGQNPPPSSPAPQAILSPAADTMAIPATPEAHSIVGSGSFHTVRNASNSSEIAAPGSTQTSETLGPNPSQTAPVVEDAERQLSLHAGAVPAVMDAQLPVQAPAADATKSSQEAVIPAARQRAIVFHEALLPIQPTITNHTALAVPDLAASLPSVPAATKNAPEPAKSDGALIRFTSELAGMIVPQSYLLVAAVVIAPIIVSVTVLGPLVLEPFIYSYGLWLRRGGFATAARSDASSAQWLAAPDWLGYVSTLWRLHSPFLDRAAYGGLFHIVFSAGLTRNYAIL